MANAVAATGAFAIGLVEIAGRTTILFWEAVRQLSRVFTNLGKVVDQMLLVGVYSLPVVSITAVFSGMVISAQTGLAMKQSLGQPVFLGAVVGGAMMREMGPVLTAVVVAGFVGGGMASVLGTMRVNEEIDALEVMAVNPVRYLVMPRLVAMTLMTPLLAVYADALGIMGGAAVARAQLDVPINVFLYDAWLFMQIKDLLFGMFKSLIFGLLICMVACDQGFNAKGGAEGVGRAVMSTVVYSFLLLLISNFLMFSLIWRPFLSN
jgi:phospholipid/cholesterol/gamma-HCH transport system permease protein